MEKNEGYKIGIVDRGATRPEMENGKNGMNEEYRLKMLTEHHLKTQWIYWTIILLGIWMILSPLTFDYGRGLVSPTGGRIVWLEVSARSNILMWSDIISGILIVLLGFRSLKPNQPVSLWLICFIGAWLNAAPLIFWAPSSMIYLNETFMGIFLISLTILIPGMPNMIHYMKMGPEVPPGWSYNPSSWAQRSILIALGFAGFIVSRYLAAYQLGFINHVWDPFFGDSSRMVLHSKMSESLPISDAGLGTFAYTFEFLMGWMGSPSRWRTMPWMVTIFGILVIPLGSVHIFLVISQPVVVGHWCTFCLLAALIMLPMIPLEVDEVVAMMQFMRKSKREGKSLWRVFWKGGNIDGGDKDERSPQLEKFYEAPGEVYKASLWGMSFPVHLITASLLGLWLIFSPEIFGNTQTAADIEHLAGALIFTFSVFAMGETIRTFRFINLLIALLVIISPFVFSLYTTGGFINDIIIGILVITFTIPKGIIKENYGTWNKMIK